MGIPGHYTDRDNFYIIRRKVKSGTTTRIDSYCKDCNKKRVRKWRLEHPELVRAYNRRWYWNDVDRIREINRMRSRIERGKFAWTWKRFRLDEYEQRVDVDAFHQWLHEYVAPLCATKEEIQEASGRGDGSVHGLISFTRIGELVGYDFSKILQGIQKTVPIRVVEKTGALFDRMELTYELYPPDEEADHCAA